MTTVLFNISDDLYGQYVSSAANTYHPPVAPVLSVADMIPPPPPPPGEGPLEGLLSNLQIQIKWFYLKLWTFGRSLC